MAKEWSVTLNTGTKMPAFGLGTSGSTPGEVASAVEAALRAGYRSFDFAEHYANEAEIGEALQKCFKEGVVKREEVFLTSKVWNSWHAREDVLLSCQKSLKDLRLDYLDLILIHWPAELRKGSVWGKLTDDDKLGYNPDRIAQCWKGMEDLVEKGMVRAIGLSNFTITKTERLLQTAKIPPAANQVECHPYLQQQKLKEYCDSKGIALVAYSPLCCPGPQRDMKESDPNVLVDPVIKKIASKHNATVAQVCISFALHRGLVVIPKTVNPARLTENLKSTELKLDAEDMKQLRGLDRNYRWISGILMMKTGGSVDDFWDVKEDEEYVVKPPEA